MPNETNLTVDEEIREINLRISRLKEEIAENYKIASEFQKEANRLSTENEQRVERVEPSLPSATTSKSGTTATSSVNSPSLLLSPRSGGFWMSVLTPTTKSG